MAKNFNKNKKLFLPLIFGLVVGSFLVASAVLALDTGIGYGTFSGLGTQDLRVSVMNIVRVILGFLGVLAVLIILYGGYIWMTAGGNAERIATAKKILTNGVIGLVIILLAFAIASFIINQLLRATGAIGLEADVCDEPGEVGTVNGCYLCTDLSGGIYSWQVDCGIAGCCPGLQQCGVVDISPVSPPDRPLNTVVRVRFSLVNVTNVDDIEIIDTSSGLPVSVERTIYGNTVELVPTDFCDPPLESLRCFNPNATFDIVVNPGAIQCGGQNLICGGFPDPCRGSFTTGDFVDTQPPTAQLIDTQICQSPTNELKALVDDDYGIDNVKFRDGTYGVLIGVDDSVDVPPAGFALVNWDTSSYGVNEVITLWADATDYDAHVASDDQTVTIRAGHCCNAVRDADETDLNCGGLDCEPCNPVIEWVEPLDGEEGNLITIHGRHFEDTPGVVTFLGDPNDSGADDQNGIDPVAVNPQCSGYWADQEIVTLVPDAQDGPIMVRRPDSLSDRTDQLPGGTMPDFDRNDISRPGICLLTPISGEPDDNVVVEGLRLVNGSDVYFGATLAGGNPVGNGLTISGAKVPNLDPAEVAVRVKSDTEFSNPKTFTVLGIPAPTSFQCSSDQLSCSPDQSKCTPDKFCNSACECEPRATCDTDEGTPACEPDQGLCDPGWFCYDPQPDGPHQPDVNKLPCYCYQTQFCDDPTQPASNQNPACHPNDSLCPENYSCDPASNCTCQPLTGIGDESAYGWFFQSGIKPGVCSDDAGSCVPNSTLCATGQTCNPTTCSCELITQFQCSSDPNSCSPDQNQCATGTFCNNQCQCESLIPCDANPDSPSCEPAACPNSYFCYSAGVSDPGYDPNKLSCFCYPGILCDGDITTPVCDPDADFCPTDYECNPNTCFCEAAGKVSDSAAYTWFFNSTAFGPRVVETCDRSNNCEADTHSSPSPYSVSGTRSGGYTVSGVRPDDGAVPVDSIITAMFTTPMLEDSINESSVIVLLCNEASRLVDNEVVPQPFAASACGTQQIIGADGVDVHSCDYGGEMVTCFDFEPSVFLTKNYWYQVTLNTNQIIGLNGVNLIGNSVDGDYRWVFKTRDSDQLSQVSCVYVEPTYQTSYIDNDLKQWTSYAASQDFVCVVMNPDTACSQGWDWNTSDVSKAEIATKSGNKSTTRALEETVANQPVEVVAECSFDNGVVDGEGFLTIDFSSPYVIDKFPDCGTACLNARIGATFSRAMADSSVTNAIKLYICYNNPACPLEFADEVTNFSKPIAPEPSPPEKPNTFIGDVPCFDVNADGNQDYCLLPDTYYRVVINNTAQSTEGKSLAGLNFDDSSNGVGALDSFSWVFKTQKDAGICLPEVIDVSPSDYLAPVDITVNYSSRPRTAPDSCDPVFGQRLNPYIWSWDYDSNLISQQFDSPYCSGGEVANLLDNSPGTPDDYCPAHSPGGLRRSCGSGVRESGEDCDDGNMVDGDGCSASCLDEGTLQTATVPPICGNRIIESGEECDPPESQAGLRYCGEDCLWTGNTNSFDVCGNGVIEFSEECEYPNTLGCGANCLLSGTAAGSICGNGVINQGEECDEGERLNGDAPSDGSDYDGDGVFCSGRCLIENRDKGFCRSVATNIFDFSPGACLGSCGFGGYSCVTLNTVTGNTNTGSVCGNRIIESGEECDLGGLCDDNSKPCTNYNLANCADPATASCIHKDSYCYDPGHDTDGVDCGAGVNVGDACGTDDTDPNTTPDGVCITNACANNCLNAGYPSGLYSTNISPYQIVSTVDDGETYIQSWISNYSPASFGPMGEGHLLVGDGGGNRFIIVERWPDCGTACLNAQIGARFSKSADPNTINDAGYDADLVNDNIFFYECGLDNNCDITSLAPIDISVDADIELIINDTFRINLPPFYNLVDHDNNPGTVVVNALLPNTYYRVVVRNRVMSAAPDSLALEGLNFDDPNFEYENSATGSRLDSHSWVFRTQETSELCDLDSVNINPEEYFASADETIRYNAEPRSAPDDCDPRFGQRLNAFYYDWDWADEEITYNPAPPPEFLNAADLLTPLRDGCGNGLLQFGEDCDDGNLDNGDSCSDICLNEGNDSAGGEVKEFQPFIGTLSWLDDQNPKINGSNFSFLQTLDTARNASNVFVIYDGGQAKLVITHNAAAAVTQGETTWQVYSLIPTETSLMDLEQAHSDPTSDTVTENIDGVLGQWQWTTGIDGVVININQLKGVIVKPTDWADASGQPTQKWYFQASNNSYQLDRTKSLYIANYNGKFYFSQASNLNEDPADFLCGNGRLDEGEECEPPNSNYCDERCLWTGNTNYNFTPGGGYQLVDICGNGVIEPAEECDEGNEPNGNDADGCTDFCRYSGSVPAATSICGDGQIGLGEECDQGELSTATPIVSGDGCSGLDDVNPCVGLGRDQCTAFPTANSCYWTGSICKIRPCLKENQSVNICRSDRTNEFDFNQSTLNCDSGYSAESLASVTGNNNFDIPVCGNQINDFGEECDLGGRCSDNGQLCTPLDLSNCSNPATAVCQLALGVCSSTGATCSTIGAACGSDGSCFSANCTDQCLNAGAVEPSLLVDTLIDPYQLVDTLSVPTTLSEVNEEIKAWAVTKLDSQGVSLLHVVPGSEVDFAVIGHQPPVGATDQCLNTAVWAVFSRKLNTETLTPDTFRLCDGGNCTLIKDYSYRIIQGRCGEDNFCHFPDNLSDIGGFGTCHQDFDCVGSQVIVDSLNTATGFFEENHTYQVVIDENALADVNGTTLADGGHCQEADKACNWSFTTGSDFCECEYVSVSINPTSGGAETLDDIFTCVDDDCGSDTITPFDDDAADDNPADIEEDLPGNQHLYDTTCYDIHNDLGSRLPLLPTGLKFDWAVLSPDDLIYLTDNDPTDFINDSSYVIPNNNNGTSDVLINAYEYHCADSDNFCDPQAPACASCSANQAVKQTVNVINFICSNPWPALTPFEDSDVNCDDANNCYDTNFSLLYCRDWGISGRQDDLPALDEDPLALGNNPISPSIKDLIFSFDSQNISQPVGQYQYGPYVWGNPNGLPAYQFSVAESGEYNVKIDGYNYPSFGMDADLSSRVQSNSNLFNQAVNYNGFRVDVYLRTGDCSAPAVEKSGTAVILPDDASNPQSDTVSLGNLEAGENYCLYFDWTNDWCQCTSAVSGGNCNGTLDNQCDANFYFSGWQVNRADISNDAIGFRVMENPLHLSPATWYASGLCGGVPEIDNICFSDLDCLASNDSTLLAYYPLDYDGTDLVGSFDATVNDVSFTAAGKVNRAANFTGEARQYIQVNPLPDSLELQDEFSVSAWVRPTAGTSPVGRVVANSYDWCDPATASCREAGWILGLDWGCSGTDCVPLNSFGFIVTNGRGVRISAGYSDFFTQYLNQWVQVTGVYNLSRSTIELYLDGVLVDYSTIPGNFGPIDYPDGFPLRIGQRSDNDNQGMWQGQIDDFRIYSRALSDVEVGALANAGILECQFNIPSQGSPSVLTVDSYQAVNDGRTVYVGATNRQANQLWSNIYLMSYNQDASADTIEIFNRLLDPEQQTGWWSFNTNFSNHRICDVYGYYEDTDFICSGIGTSNFSYCSTLGTSAACDAAAQQSGCYWSDQFDICLAKICQPIYCTNDFSCPNLSCNANKEKVVRDARRYSDLRDGQIVLDDLGTTSGSYPTLTGGSYITDTSFSRWPSWQQTLGASLGGTLSVDPINRFVGCSVYYCDDSADGIIESGERTFCNVGDVTACADRPYRCLSIDPDQEGTCWDEISKEFSCPAQMFVYAYHTGDNGADYNLYTTFEYDQIGTWRTRPGYYCDISGNGAIEIDVETISCDPGVGCNVGTCLISADTDLYQLPLTATDSECRELNFILAAATVSGGASVADCPEKRCYGGSNDPTLHSCNSGAVSECPDDGPGTYCSGDADYDAVCDNDVGTDNCSPPVDCPGNPRDCYNPDQRDSGGIPGKGDVCDVTCSSDTDSDGVCDSTDNCRNVYNPNGASCVAGHNNRGDSGQCDYDLDGIGDACDPCTDSDFDGFWDIDTGTNNSSICPKDNCSPGLPTSADKFGYCGGDLSVQCDRVNDDNGDGVTNGDELCAQAGLGACLAMDTYNPYQEDYDGDGLGYICDFCLDFDGDSHGDYPFYTGSMFSTALTPNQQEHFEACHGSPANFEGPVTPADGNINDLDNCPGGPFGPTCQDEFGIEISCSNPSGIEWPDSTGVLHTGQADFNLDGKGDICDEFTAGLVNCGDGIVQASGGEVCDCGRYGLPDQSDPQDLNPFVCNTLNDQPCNPGYDGDAGNGIDSCSWCSRCEQVRTQTAGYCGDNQFQGGDEVCELDVSGCQDGCDVFNADQFYQDYCLAAGYDIQYLNFGTAGATTYAVTSPGGSTAINIPNACSLTQTNTISLDVKIDNVVTASNLPKIALVFVTDLSGSMAGTPLADAQAAINTTIDDLFAADFPGNVYVGLVSYSGLSGDDVSIGGGCPNTPADPANTSLCGLADKDWLKNIVNNYDTYAETRTDMGINTGWEILKRGNLYFDYKIMVVMSDGGCSCNSTCAEFHLLQGGWTCEAASAGCDSDGFTTVEGSCEGLLIHSPTCYYSCNATNEAQLVKNDGTQIYAISYGGDWSMNAISSNNGSGDCNYGYCYSSTDFLTMYGAIYNSIYNNVASQLNYNFGVTIDGSVSTALDLDFQRLDGGYYPNQSITVPANFCDNQTHTLQVSGLSTGVTATLSNAQIVNCETCDVDNDNIIDEGCGGNDCYPNDINLPAAENCSNSIDDDCDGAVDDADFDCVNNCVGGVCGTIAEICDNGVDDDVDTLTDCTDPDCATQTGPNGVICCQARANCGTCESCQNNICVGVSVVNGQNCEDACTFCSSGACISRLNGDSRECPAGWACNGSLCSPTVSDEQCNQTGDEDGNGLADCADPACAGQIGPTSGQVCCQTNDSCAYLVCHTCSNNVCVGYSGLGDNSNCSSACDYCSTDFSCLSRSNGDGIECPTGQTCQGGACQDAGSSTTCSFAPPAATRLCPIQTGVCSGALESCVSPGIWPGCDAATYLAHSSAFEATFEVSCADGVDNDCDGLTDNNDPNCQVACNDNGICDSASGENCSVCPDECPCLPGQLCCGVSDFSCQVPACNINTDCNDSNPGTTDICQGAGGCNAACVHNQITACLNNDGYCPTGCNTGNDNDCPTVDSCSQTDGGNADYQNVGTVSGSNGGVSFNQTDGCVNSTTLTEYGCNAGATNLVSANFTCTNLGANYICSNGACLATAGVSSCTDTDGGQTDYLTFGTVSGQVNSVSYSYSDSCSSNILTERYCSGQQAGLASFDCTTLGAGYSCSSGRCVSPPPVFVNYYCDLDDDGIVSANVTVNCQQGASGCPPDPSCTTAAGTDCDDGKAAVYPGADEIACDGVNNDCDALVDEDYIPVISSCGVGACATTGQLICQSGTINDSCTPLPPANEVCGDGADNDCNGTVDNGCVNECTPGATIACGVLDPVNYKGVCANPTITCNALGSWPRAECLNPKQPNEISLCTDNLDNDCDGWADCQETIDCPSGNVCSGNCLAGSACNQTTFDWVCNAESDAGCGGTGNACGLCVETSSNNFNCQANAGACSGFACGVCQDQGGGVNYSCAPNNNACTAICSTCDPSTLNCQSVTNAQDCDGTVQCCGTVGCTGGACSCNDSGVCQSCDDFDNDAVCNQNDICPYDPSNDLDNDGLCAVGCFTGLSRVGSLTNGWLCDVNASNVLYDTCQGGLNQDSGGISGVPDDCEVNSCKVVFGAQDYVNIYINGKLVTGNLYLPHYVSGNPPANVIDNVYLDLNNYVVSGTNVIAFEAYVEKARGAYPDYTQAYRQIRGAFAKVTDPNCTSPDGCALCDAAGLAGTALRTDPVGNSYTPDMPLKCLVVNDATTLPPADWNQASFNDSAWASSASGSGWITDPYQEIESRLWGEAYSSSLTSPRYNSPKAVWTGGNYTSTSQIYCRYTFIK